MKDIVSRYTYLFQRSEACYLYNAETAIFSEIDKEAYLSLEKGLVHELPKELCEELKTNRIIVKGAEQDDFYLRRKFKFQAASFSQDLLSLTVMPTTGCNFACSYCFEKNKKHSLMTNETLEALVSFIKDHNKAKGLNITWYGGEPLLGFNLIQRFNDLFREHVPIPMLGQSIVTNGYLLSEAKLRYFSEIGLTSMQVTLDGIRQNHDKSRYLIINKRGTFDTILKNLDRAMEMLPNCHISIRVNINKENKADFAILYKELNDRWKGQNVSVYPGFIREDTPDGCSFCTQCIAAKDRVDFYLSLREKGINVDLFPSPITGHGCMMNTINSYVIDPNGAIYKCWNDVSDESKIVGNIRDEKLLNEGLLYRYTCECSPFEDPHCKECSLLPICEGGCGWYRYRNKFEGGRFNVCSMYKDRQKLEEAILKSVLEPISSPYPTIKF